MAIAQYSMATDLQTILHIRTTSGFLFFLPKHPMGPTKGDMGNEWPFGGMETHIEYVNIIHK